MKRSGFLNKLKKEGKLELVEPSEEISDSYLEKSSNSLKAAQILIKSGLLEESVSMSYYSMYHCLLALMVKCGIKCENHAGNIILLKKIFKENKLYETISKAKKERIDKQYYVDFEIIKKDVEEQIEKAQYFITKIRLIIENLKNEDIKNLRKEFMACLKKFNIKRKH